MTKNYGNPSEAGFLCPTRRVCRLRRSYIPSDFPNPDGRKLIDRPHPYEMLFMAALAGHSSNGSGSLDA